MATPTVQPQLCPFSLSASDSRLATPGGAPATGITAAPCVGAQCKLWRLYPKADGSIDLNNGDCAVNVLTDMVSAIGQLTAQRFAPASKEK